MQRRSSTTFTTSGRWLPWRPAEPRSRRRRHRHRSPSHSCSRPAICGRAVRAPSRTAHVSRTALHSDWLNSHRASREPTIRQESGFRRLPRQRAPPLPCSLPELKCKPLSLPWKQYLSVYICHMVSTTQSSVRRMQCKPIHHLSHGNKGTALHGKAAVPTRQSCAALLTTYQP